VRELRVILILALLAGIAGSVVLAADTHGFTAEMRWYATTTIPATLPRLERVPLMIFSMRARP
jgi:hypothetical protein